MKVSNYHKAFSALAFLGLTGLVALMMDTYNKPEREDDLTFEYDQEAVYQRALNDSKKEPYIIDIASVKRVKVLDENNLIIDQFDLDDDLNLQTLRLGRRATYISECNNLVIYKVLE